MGPDRPWTLHILIVHRGHILSQYVRLVSMLAGDMQGSRRPTVGGLSVYSWAMAQGSETALQNVSNSIW